MQCNTARRSIVYSTARQQAGWLVVGWLLLQPPCHFTNLQIGELLLLGEGVRVKVLRSIITQGLHAVLERLDLCLAGRGEGGNKIKIKTKPTTNNNGRATMSQGHGKEGNNDGDITNTPASDKRASQRTTHTHNPTHTCMSRS